MWVAHVKGQKKGEEVDGETHEIFVMKLNRIANANKDSPSLARRSAFACLFLDESW